MIATSDAAPARQDRRIDQRRDRLALHRRDDLRVLDVAPQHRVEVAAALAGQQRRRVDAGKQRRRARRTRPTARVPDRTCSCTSSSTLRKTGDVDAPLQQVERLDQRHAGLEQRRQLLVEDQELAGGDPRRAAAAAATERRAIRARWMREDEQALLLELVPQPRFAVGDVDAFDDLAARRCRAGSETPWTQRADPSSPAQDLVCVDIIGRSIRNYTTACVPAAARRPPGG